MNMNIEDLNARSANLCKEITIPNRERNFNTLEQIERLMEAYLEQDPHHVGLLLKLAVLELCSPLMDIDRSVSYLRKVHSQEEDNPHALILLALSVTPSMLDCQRICFEN